MEKSPQFERIENESVVAMELDVPSNLDMVEGVKDFFQKWLEKNIKFNFANPEDKEDFIGYAGFGFKEALVNAITYGNLKWEQQAGEDLTEEDSSGVASEGRISTGKREQSIRLWAKNHPKLAALKSKIHLEINSKGIVVRVGDHEPNFALTHHPAKDAIADDNLYDQTGRGFVYMNGFYDELKFTQNPNHDGKVLIMKKYFVKPEEKSPTER